MYNRYKVNILFPFNVMS